MQLISSMTGDSTSIAKLMGGEKPPSTLESERAENDRMNKSKDHGGDQYTAPNYPGSPKDSGADEDGIVNTQEEEQLDDGGDGWKFNLAMVLISFYVGMQLTNWYIYVLV